MMKLKQPERWLGWGIRLPYDYYALAGVLFWEEPPDHLKAIRVAVFATRKAAREANKTIKGKVVRLEAIIREVL